MIYRVVPASIPTREQRWNVYAFSLLAFSVVSVLVLYAQLRLQGHLPLNPDRPDGGASPALVVQHRGELPHQHELAELRG